MVVMWDGRLSSTFNVTKRGREGEQREGGRGKEIGARVSKKH